MKIKQLFDDNHLVIQQKSYTCGPVTLLNILRLKGDFSRNEEEMEQLCNTKPNRGTKLEDFLNAAKEIGLEVLEAKEHAALNDIEQHIDAGHYVAVNYWDAFSDVGHLSLIVEYDDKAYYFHDCSLGFLRLEKDELDQNWYGQNKTSHRWFAAIK